jgi:hypothetical protein
VLLLSPVIQKTCGKRVTKIEKEGGKVFKAGEKVKKALPENGEYQRRSLNWKK